MLPTIASAALPTGVHLPYAEHGDAHGIPVLFLHGVTDSWRSFEEVLDALPAGIRGIALTQRGHGDADKPPIDYRIADMAADAVALLDVLRIDRAVIVGHSMGGWVAQQVLIAHPERVLGAVLVGGFASGRGSAEIDAYNAEIQALTDPVPEAVAREFQLSTIADPIDPERLDLYVAETLKLPAQVWRSAFAGFAELDLTPGLASVTAPTLLVYGEQDAVVPPAQRDALRAALPAARLVVYEGVGHAVHWERCERFAADVAAFAAEVG